MALKRVVIIETITIVILIAVLFLIIHSIKNDNNTSYCDTHYYDNKICLLSSRVYANILPAKSLLILNFKPLQQNIENYIAENRINASLYVLNVRDSASFSLNDGRSYEPASLNKLPIAIIILKKVEDGELKLTTMLPILDRDRDSSSGTLYQTSKTEMSVDKLLGYMLSESDNTAFRVFEGIVTLKDLNTLSTYLNYYVEDINYLDAGNNSYAITPKSTSNLFMSLYLSTILTPEHSEKILNLLTNTSFDINKYADLPKDITVAQKYGSYFVGNIKEFHDCGLMYIKDSRIFYCVMTDGLDREPASQAIGTIVNKLYNFVVEQKQIKNIDI